MKRSTANEKGAIVIMALSLLLPMVTTIVDYATAHDNTHNAIYGRYVGGSTCAGPDLIITSVGLHTNPGDRGKRCTVKIKNIGNTTAVFDYPRIAGWQAFLSSDGVSKDLRVKGENFFGTLDVDQTTSATTVISSDLFSKQHYLIVELYVLSSVGECNSNNNTFVYSSLQ